MVNPYSRLEGWVYHATFTLARPEGPRAELRQRLMERTAALETQGLNSAQAQEQALQEAGDSSEVRRQLEHRHFTTKEWVYMEDLSGSSSPSRPHSWKDIAGLGVLCVLYYLVFFVWFNLKELGVAFIIAFVARGLLSDSLSKRFSGVKLYKRRWFLWLFSLLLIFTIFPLFSPFATLAGDKYKVSFPYLW